MFENFFLLMIFLKWSSRTWSRSLDQRDFHPSQKNSCLYEELGCEILYYRRWYRCLCHFYNLRNDQRTLYLFSEIPQEHTLHYSLRRPSVYEPNVKSTERFSHTYFQNCLGEWNQLDETIKNRQQFLCLKGNSCT